MLTDSRGRTYKNAEEWMKEVAKSPLAEINAITARDHETGCWRVQVERAKRTGDRDLAKRTSPPAAKIGGGRISA